MKRGIPRVKTAWVECTDKLMDLGFYFLSQFVQLTFSFCVVFLIYLDLGGQKQNSSIFKKTTKAGFKGCVIVYFWLSMLYEANY